MTLGSRAVRHIRDRVCYTAYQESTVAESQIDGSGAISAMGRPSPQAGNEAVEQPGIPQITQIPRTAGNRLVPAEIGSSYLAGDWGQQLMLLSDFVQEHCCTGRPVQE